MRLSSVATILADYYREAAELINLFMTFIFYPKVLAFPREHLFEIPKACQ